MLGSYLCRVSRHGVAMHIHSALPRTTSELRCYREETLIYCIKKNKGMYKVIFLIKSKIMNLVRIQNEHVSKITDY